MAMIKVIEVLAESHKSWEDAAREAVKYAGKTIKNIRSVYVSDQSCVVEDGKVTKYRITTKISFEVDR